MTELKSSKNVFKSIGAVVAGIIVIVVLSVVTDMILESVGIFPPPDNGLFDPWMLLVALAYRTVYAFFGGYITAALSPQNPMNHVKVLLGIGTVMGILGVIGGWNLSAHWYPIGLVITSAFAVWYGGMMKMKKTT